MIYHGSDVSNTPRRPARAPNPRVGQATDSSTYDPVRAAAFKMALGLIFLRFSMLHQVQALLMGVNLRLLYVVGIPALLGLFIGGGITRTFRGRPAVYLVGFAICMILATPFSYWPGASAHLLLGYFRVDFIMLFIVAGLVVSWQECELVMCTIAWAAAFNLLTSKVFLQEHGDRLSLGFGSIGDPNDFAAHLLLVLPFLLWATFTAKSLMLRLTALLGVAYGCFVILGTGSRGGLVGMTAVMLVFLFRATALQRVAFFVASPVVVLVILSSVPAETLHRVTSFSASTTDSGEATASKEARQYLLRKSIEYTVTHPLLGVGPGEFSEYEGSHNRIDGTNHGSWHQTHNTFTQVSSECGIPAFLFFLASIISSFTLLNSTYRQTSKIPGCSDMRAMALCIILGMIGFCVAIFFLSLAYFYYIPAICGLSISVSCAAREELISREHRIA